MKKIKGQEEMVGFALIVIIVAVILVVIIGLSLNRGQKEAVQSYEAESFMQAALQYTSECSINEYLSVKELISSCNTNDICDDGKKTCDILNSTLKSIVKESWDIGAESPYKGYEMILETEQGRILNISRGNFTNNYKGAFESFAKRGETYNINFKIFY